MRDILTSLVTNLHILALSLLITALSLGVVGTTPDNRATSGERWRVMITTPHPTEVITEQPTDQKTEQTNDQSITHGYVPSEPFLPW